MGVIRIKPLTCIGSITHKVLKEVNDPSKHSAELTSYINSMLTKFNTTAGPGVYIWGVRKLVNGKQFFWPWYVGKHETNVVTRLRSHYKTDNWKRELFSIDKVSPSAFYSCIEAYNVHRLNRSQEKTIGRNLHAFRRNQHAEVLSFFSSPTFWNSNQLSRDTVITENIKGKLRERVSQEGILFDPLVPENIKRQVMDARNYLAENFCFTYAECNESNCGNPSCMERTVKDYFEKNGGIFTSSKAGKTCGCSTTVDVSEMLPPNHSISSIVLVDTSRKNHA